MNGKRTRDTSPAGTDWEYLRDATDEDIRRGLAEDPDAQPTDPAFWKDAEWVTPETRKMRVPESKSPGLLDENDVVEALCAHLEADGWTILERCTTTKQGVDIVAEQRSTGARVWVEAKGATSSRPGSTRFDKGFTPNQVFARVAKGLYSAAQLCDRPDRNGARVVLAFPDYPQFRRRVQAIGPSLTTLGIELLWVRPDRTVVDS